MANAKREDFLAVSRGVEITQTSLTINAPLSYSEWEALGAKLQRAHKSILFLLGDWLLWGERAFNQEFSQAIEARGYAIQTMLNCQWVASRVDRSRRRESLSWSHHLEVASLADQDQDKLLQAAVTNDWGVRELRNAVRTFKGKVVKEQRGKLAGSDKRGGVMGFSFGMDFSFGEWSTRALVLFAVHAQECWRSLPDSDGTASDDFSHLMNSIVDELRRRGEWDERMEELVIRPIDEPLIATLDRVGHAFGEAGQ